MSCFVVKSSEKRPILQFEGTSYCGVRRFGLVLALSRVVSFFLGFKNQSLDWKHPRRSRERPLVIIPLAPLGFFCSASSSVELEGSFGLVSSPTQWVELIEWWNLTSFECVLDLESVNVFLFQTMKEKAAAIVKRVISLLHWKGTITKCKQYFRKRQAP